MVIVQRYRLPLVPSLSATDRASAAQVISVIINAGPLFPNRAVRGTVRGLGLPKGGAVWGELDAEFFPTLGTHIPHAQSRKTGPTTAGGRAECCFKSHRKEKRTSFQPQRFLRSREGRRIRSILVCTPPHSAAHSSLLSIPPGPATTKAMSGPRRRPWAGALTDGADPLVDSLSLFF
jgi:hypothetical protein